MPKIGNLVYPDEFNLDDYLRDNNISLKDLLMRLEVSGQFDTSENLGTKVSSIGGRLGYNQPIGNGNLNFGISAGGYKVKNKNFKDSGFNIHGIDANYTQGDNSYGISYSPDELNLMYERRF